MKLPDIQVNCPACSNPVIWNEKNPWRPFCCKRCQLIDLDEWANEKKIIPGDENLSLHENENNE